MIVDDSVTSRRMLRKIVEETRKHVVLCEAVNGEEAIKKYNTFHPDVVTMDVAMPQLSGVIATQEIVKNDPKAKILIVSGLNDKRLVVQALKAGAKRYLLKPIDKQKLLDEIEGVLNENG